jgi:hypothetical protein
MSHRIRWKGLVLFAVVCNCPPVWGRTGKVEKIKPATVERIEGKPANSP